MGHPQWADEQLVEINSNFTGRLEERTKDASERLEVLRARIDSLEEVRAWTSAPHLPLHACVRREAQPWLHSRRLCVLHAAYWVPLVSLPWRQGPSFAVQLTLHVMRWGSCACVRVQYFAREKERILREIEERGAELSKLLHEFQVSQYDTPHDMIPY